MIFLLPHAVDAAAEQAPDREAVRYLEQRLSYVELARRSNALAHVLVEQGVRRRDRVGIYMDKCLDMASVMYGIMKAGAAYVPLDPGAPVERLRFVIEDCGIRHLVTAEDKLANVAAISAQGTDLQCLIGVAQAPAPTLRCVPWEQVWTQAADAPPGVRTIEQDLAYIIYTSGSTGVPKGIMHTHHSGLSFARWAAHEYGLRADDRLSNHAPLHFDLSVFDFFAGAVAGACTAIIPEEHARLPASYSQLLAGQRISVLFTVPFALIQLLLRGALERRDLSALRWAIYGGEPFPVKHLRALMARLPHVRFDNMYGPAEVNGCTHYTVPPLRDGDTQIPIGEICRIAQAMVVGDDDEPVAPGEAGELLVRTPTMMQGYWRRPDLNAAAFSRRHRFDDYADVYYRTGDLVQQRADGVLLFLGRKDRQVKVRGYRIELDEIEAVLTGTDAVEEAAAFAVPDTEGSQQIRAAVTLRQDVRASADELLGQLRARLPRYAVPDTLELRQCFPRTTTGKIDRRKLREEALEEACASASAGPTTTRSA